MAIKGWTDVGSLASYLVFVRQAALPINQVHQAVQFPGWLLWPVRSVSLT